jgi:hypothetical protein
VTTEDEIKRKFEALAPNMDERVTRLWAAAEATVLGHGGIATVERATGLSRTTIRAGIVELREGATPDDVVQVRRSGGGRPSIEQTSPGIVDTLEALVDPVTRGDPMSPLRWTSKSTRKLAEELSVKGYPISPQKVGELLHDSGYSLQATQKRLEGTSHPDRNEQFEFISTRVDGFHGRGAPVISVDTKKKELIGDYTKAGKEWQPVGEPVPVNTYDFLDPTRGKVIPYGVYDIARNEAWVSVGVDHDTPEYAVRSIAEWWKRMGRRAYEGATELLITADGGGSNGSRCRLWKFELQAFADRTGLAISVCHFPPGTSKWNKIEHRLFCHITENWRGRPLVDHETVIQTIGSVRTATGLVVKAALDLREYEKGIEVTDAEMDGILLTKATFHGEWNYTIHPRRHAQL